MVKLSKKGKVKTTSSVNSKNNTKKHTKNNKNNTNNKKTTKKQKNKKTTKKQKNKKTTKKQKNKKTTKKQKRKHKNNLKIMKGGIAWTMEDYLKDKYGIKVNDTVTAIDIKNPVDKTGCYFTCGIMMYRSMFLLTQIYNQATINTYAYSDFEKLGERLKEPNLYFETHRRFNLTDIPKHIEPGIVKFDSLSCDYSNIDWRPIDDIHNSSQYPSPITHTDSANESRTITLTKSDALSTHIARLKSDRTKKFGAGNDDHSLEPRIFSNNKYFEGFEKSKEVFKTNLEKNFKLFEPPADISAMQPVENHFKTIRSECMTKLTVGKKMPLILGTKELMGIFTSYNDNLFIALAHNSWTPNINCNFMIHMLMMIKEFIFIVPASSIQEAGLQTTCSTNSNIEYKEAEKRVTISELVVLTRLLQKKVIEVEVIKKYDLYKDSGGVIQFKQFSKTEAQAEYDKNEAFKLNADLEKGHTFQNPFMTLHVKAKPEFKTMVATASKYASNTVGIMTIKTSKGLEQWYNTEPIYSLNEIDHETISDAAAAQ
jgi:predicted flap endonuclease-1-like 5' DNA nuclease